MVDVTKAGAYPFARCGTEADWLRSRLYPTTFVKPVEFTMNFRPLYDRVLVKRVNAETRTAGGLIIPDTAKEKPQEALVVAVGNGRVLENGSVRAMSLNVGDKVLFGKYTGDEIKLEGEEHLILREEDILAVLS